MESGNIRRLYVIYWRHPTLDWENARTTEFYTELIYNDKIRMPMRTDIDFRFMNCHRETESYHLHKETIEYYRRYKLRREPLVYFEFWHPNKKGEREEFISIDSDYRLKLVLNKIIEYLQPQATAA